VPLRQLRMLSALMLLIGRALLLLSTELKMLELVA